MNRTHRIAALFAGTLLTTIAFAAGPAAAQAGMMGQSGGGAAPMMRMRGCPRDDAPCAARMKEHRQRLEQMHAVVLQLKTAKSDKQRVALLQQYVELMDAQMSQMMEMMDARMPAPAQPAVDGDQ